MLVSGSYFPLLGVRPALGRLLGPEDDREIGAHPVAVLSHDFWQNELGADPGVLNRSIVVNGQSLTVVGVAPRGFTGTTLGSTPDVFVPITMRGALESYFDDFENRRSYWAYLFGRLKPGVDLETATARINAPYSAIIGEVEAPLQEMSAESLERFRNKRLVLEPGARGQSNMHSEVETPLRLLMAITGVVLLIACANIANLLLARGARRAQEMAIRGSLGAGRWALVRQLLTESMVLAVMGGAASLLVANWTLMAISRALPDGDTDAFSLAIGPEVLAFTGIVAILTGVLFGVYPALHATRQDLVSMLKAGGGQPSEQGRAKRFRQILVTGQIALSMTLLVAAGLFIKSLSNVSRVDLGLETEGIVTFAIAPALNGYENEASEQLFIRTERELEAISGVNGVTAALVPVLGGSSWGTDVNVEGFENGPDIDSNSRYNEVGPGFFSVMGMPLLVGREFTEADTREAPPVAVVNERFLEKFGLSRGEAVGTFMSNHGSGGELNIEIVGVVQDAAYSEVKGDVPPLFFLPYRQGNQLGWKTFYVRSGLPAEQVVAQVRAKMSELDPNLPLENVRTLDQQAAESVFLDRMISTLSVAFALLATLLAAVGLYGVLAYSVTQRRREIGVRMALGARSREVQGMVLRQVGRMGMLGGIIGVAAALSLGRFLASLLYGLEPNDAWVIGSVSILLGLVIFTAGYLPARRASRVDPIRALRQE